MKVKISAGVAAAIAAVMLSGLGLGQNSKGSKSRTITATEAEKLIYAMLEVDDWTKLPGFALTSYPNADSDFYEIEATYNNPAGSGSVGHYAVEQTTGDVWSFPVCSRYTSRALTKLQRSLCNRIGLTNADYDRLRKPGPNCAPGQVPSVLEMGKPKLDDNPKPVAREL